MSAGETTSPRLGNTKDQDLQMTVGSRTAEQDRITISCEVSISMDENDAIDAPVVAIGRKPSYVKYPHSHDDCTFQKIHNECHPEQHFCLNAQKCMYTVVLNIASGGKDPRKPGGSAPGKEHYEPSLSRRQLKNARKKAALAAKASEPEAGEGSDIEILEERKALGKFISRSGFVAKVYHLHYRIVANKRIG